MIQNFREKYLKFVSKFEKRAEKIIVYSKNKFDVITNRTEDTSGVKVGRQNVEYNDLMLNQIIIYNEKLTKNKVITLKRFSWKMFFYGWMGGPFIKAGRFFVGGLLIGFSIFYAYNFYQITKKLTIAIQDLQNEQISENIKDGSDVRKRLAVQSSSIPDAIALIISIFCGFFGEAICLHKYLQNGWKIFNASDENKQFLRKKYFIKIN